MPIQTITPEKALRKSFIEKTILTKMNPQLTFLQSFPVRDTGGADVFEYFQDVVSAEDDITSGTMDTPVQITELGKLRTIKVTPIERKAGTLYEFGASIQFSRKIKNNNIMVDEVLRAYDRVAYAMSRKLNGDIVNNLDVSAAAPAITINTAWNSETGEQQIRDDVLKMQENFDQTGWDLELTDLHVNKGTYYAAARWVRGRNEPWNEDIEGTQLRNAKTNVTLGTGYGYDRKSPPLTMFKNTEPDYSTDPKNSLIMVNDYIQQGYPYNRVIDIWACVGMAVKNGYGALKQTGFGT